MDRLEVKFFFKVSKICSFRVLWASEYKIVYRIFLIISRVFFIQQYICYFSNSSIEKLIHFQKKIYSNEWDYQNYEIFFWRILFSPTKSKLGGNRGKKAGETFNKLRKGRGYCLTETGAVCKVSDRDRLIADNRRCFQVAVLFRVFPMEWSVSRLNAKCSKNFYSWGRGGRLSFLRYWRSFQTSSFSAENYNSRV